MKKSDIDKYYDKDIKELLVLTNDSSVCGSGDKRGMLGLKGFLAYIETDTNIIRKCDGRLVWPLTKQDLESKSYFKYFKGGHIYKIRARAFISKYLPGGYRPPFCDKFLVTEVISNDIKNKSLEEILFEYRKPVVIDDDIFGELVLYKDLEVFEGHMSYKGNEIPIGLAVDKDDKSTWDTVTDTMQKFYANLDKMDEEMRKFAAKELIELADEWQEQKTKSITEENFMSRIQLYEFTMGHEGNYCAYYDDDDMFLGHIIMVSGNSSTGIESADIAG